METPVDIKKYIAMERSYSPLEARSLSQITEETNESSAVHQMESLLASNCQKLGVGSSFQFCSPENLSSVLEQIKEKEEQAPETSDDDEYETVIYRGPDVPYEVVKRTEPKECIQPNAKHLEPMNVRLARISAENGGLLSPQFFLSPTGSPASSRGTPSSSDVLSSSLSSGASNVSSAERNPSPKMPFSFPPVNSDSNCKKENVSTDVVGDTLERIQMLDDELGEEKEAEWVEWPKKFIEHKGFCLGIQPGDFYKEESRPCYYVKLPHRSNYEVVVTNNNQIACDLDLYVNGKHTNALRLPAGISCSIDGPQYSKHAFKLFRSSEAPSGKKVEEGHKENGHIKAIFTPCKIGSSRLRTASDPEGARMRPERDILGLFNDFKGKRKKAFTIASADPDSVERSLDMSQISEGVTLLQGNQKRHKFIAASKMETDISKQVILDLRLIASLDEEVAATNDEVYCLEAPLPKKKN